MLKETFQDLEKLPSEKPNFKKSKAVLPANEQQAFTFYYMALFDGKRSCVKGVGIFSGKLGGKI